MDLSSFPLFLVFIISVVSCTLSSLINANYVKKYIDCQSKYYLVFFCLYCFATVTLLTLGGFKFNVSLYTIIIGIIFGVISVLYSFVSAVAIKNGPVGYTNLIINFSTVITAFSGFLFWNEELGVFKIIGLVFIVACFILTIDKDESGKSVNVKWFILCILSMCLSASVGLTQKIHQSSEHKGEVSSLLIIAFIVAGASSFLAFLFFRIREKSGYESGEISSIKAKRLLLSTAIMGLCSGVANFVNLYLVGAAPSALTFPIVNGVPLLLVIIVSIILFKEKFKTKQKVGLITGIIAVAFLCI